MIPKRVISVSAMRNGQSGNILKIQGGRGLHAKLAGLGLHEGARIVKKSTLMGRGPVVLSVALSDVAMGFGMAARILVEVDGE